MFKEILENINEEQNIQLIQNKIYEIISCVLYPYRMIFYVFIIFIVVQFVLFICNIGLTLRILQKMN